MLLQRLSTLGRPHAPPALSFLVLALSLAGAARAAEPAGKVQFNHDIRPILSDKCFVCHGPDSASRKAKLRLDQREDAIAKRRGGTHAVVPGKPDESELIARIFSADALDRMPPASSTLTLTEEQKQLIRRWIEEGAEYQPHWSLIPLPDQVLPPPVRNSAWPRNDLDRFVLARLEQEGLSPTPEAPRERWLRRVTFDLTGLPPTQAEIDAFVADTSPQAYERVVDRLLASPRYGEKMAISWLDVARYADSFGYQADLDTHAWPYRDWVIEAFNNNLHFDQFITWQLAGDLLPNPTRAQRLATAFLRVHRKTQEGGSVEAEFLQDGVNDRINTFGTAFLGLTVECSRCHDHKYDPITMKDYYSLGAFLNNIDEWGLLHGNTFVQPHPVLYLTTAEQDAALAKQKAAIAASEQKYQEVRSARESAFRAWLEKERLSASPLPIDLAGAYDLEQAYPGNMLRNAAKPSEPGTLAPANAFVLGRTGNGVKLTGDDAMSLTHANCRHMHDAVSVAFWLKPGEDYTRSVVFHNSDGWDPGYNGYSLQLEHGKLRWMFAREWPGNCIAVRTRAKLPTGDWTHVAVTYDGSCKAAGLKVYLNGQPADLDIVRDKLTRDCLDRGSIDFGERRRDAGLRNGTVDEIAIFGRAITPIEVAQQYDGTSLTMLLSKPTLSEAEVAAAREYFLSAIDGPTRTALAELRQTRIAYRETMDKVQEIPVMEELPDPRPAYILARGAYDAPKEQVSRETPASLIPFPQNAPRNRLGLAQWLTQPDHPLTARVTVNRFWQDLFGRGIVVTAENFGVQGQQPSHPELLDWLARDFIAHNWDVKRFVKQIVLSATYRQDSRASKALRDRDPDNVLLARGPAKRLGAEELRDSSLALAGLLRPEIGGPPVKPYQPDGSMWRSLNNFLPDYKRDKGDGLYRRSMYTFWRRTTPPPNMLVFDSSTREICAARRQLTLTPLQPLVLLNDPQFVEAARGLGQRMLQQPLTTPEARVAWLYREVTGRNPAPAELDLLKQLYAEQIEYFNKDKTRGEKLVKVGDAPVPTTLSPQDVAAATNTASAVLNLDANIMVR